MLEREFVWPVRVYYEDTDAAGIVYHANYLRFMERARTEWLRELGFEQDQLLRDHKLVFVITRSDVHYVQSARFNQQLDVRCQLSRLRRVSFAMAQSIHSLDGTSVCHAHNELACVDHDTLKPRRIPPAIMKVFQGDN